jgi:hypothetical protein
MTTDNLCFYLQNTLIQTSQTGGQLYSDTSPFCIPCFHQKRFAQLVQAPATPSNARLGCNYLGALAYYLPESMTKQKSFITLTPG